MYITALEFSHIRRFEELPLQFTSTEDSSPLTWTVLTGDNATGKSTLLRSIAIGLSDKSSAAGLLRELQGFLIQQTHDGEASINFELRDDAQNMWCIETKISRIKSFEDIEQYTYSGTINEVKAGKSEIDPSDFPWEKIFVCGYGAGRSAEGSQEYNRYRPIDAVYTLFRYDQPLQSSENTWRRLLDSAYRKAKQGKREPARERADELIKSLLHDVLMLSANEDIDLEPSGIFIQGPGFKVPLSEHADGYQSSVRWILDLVSWNLLFRKSFDAKKISGIVLIDELEQHLHPRWQRHIISRLHNQFPKIQFIVTTHSPLCAGGTADLDETECQLIGLRRMEEKIDTIAVPLPVGWRTDQILTSEIFGLPETRNPRIGRLIEKYRELFLKGEELLTPQEKRKLKKLRNALSVVPQLGQFEEERKLRDDLQKLSNELKKMMKQSKQ